MNLEQLFRDFGLAEDKLELAAKWVGTPLTHTVSRLGGGESGNAYDLHNGFALKITRDESEAKTSMHMLNKHHPNVVYITKIAKYKHKRQTIYFILQKKYAKNGLAKNLYDAIMHSLGIERDSYWPRATTDTYVQIPDDQKKLKGVVAQSFKELGISDDATIRFYVKAFSDIRASLEFMKHIGVYFKDAHFNNIMFDYSTNNFIITDLGGGSSSPHNVEPQEIAEADITRAIFKKLMERAAHRACEPS